MNREPENPEAALESDPVWELLEQSPTRPAGPSFVRKTVQLVREQEQRGRGWQRLLSPAPLVGMAAAAAAIALAVVQLRPDGATGPSVTAYDSAQAEAIQEMVETEMLWAAAEDPSGFSDQELVCLLGF